MKRGRFSQDQIIGVLREQEAGMKVAELCPNTAYRSRRSTPGRRSLAAQACRMLGRLSKPNECSPSRGVAIEMPVTIGDLIGSHENAFV